MKTPEEYEALREEAATLRVDLSLKSIQYNTAASERDALRAERDELAADLRDAHDITARYDPGSELAALRAELAELQERHRKYVDQVIADNTARSNALDMPVTVFGAERLRSENADLKTAIERMMSDGELLELADLRNEVARQADVIVELTHQRQTATAEIDRLDAIRRQQEADNLDLIAKLAALHDRCAGYVDELRLTKGSLPAEKPQR